MRKAFQAVVSALVLTLLLSTFVLWIGSQSQATDELLYSSVTVEPGDTLWHIAREAAPREDPRKVVWLIREKNQMTDVKLFPGQRLLVPVYDSAAM